MKKTEDVEKNPLHGYDYYYITRTKKKRRTKAGNVINQFRPCFAIDRSVCKCMKNAFDKCALIERTMEVIKKNTLADENKTKKYIKKEQRRKKWLT